MTISLIPSGPREVFIAHERRIDDTERGLQYRGQSPSPTGASSNAFVAPATTLSVAASTDETFVFQLAGVLTDLQESADFVPVTKPRLYQMDCVLKVVDPLDNYFTVLVNNDPITTFVIPALVKTYTATMAVFLYHVGVDYVTLRCESAGGTASDLVATARFSA